MRTKPQDDDDREDLAKLNAEPWMVKALELNPDYPHWGPHEDYMAKRVFRLCAAVLLLSCAEPPPAPAPAVTEPPRTLEVPREALTDDSGRVFPLDAYKGQWRCHTTWIRYGTSVDDYEEGERERVYISIGLNRHAPTWLTVTVEGCPFSVSPDPPPNPRAWSLGPNHCGATRYHDGFLILDAEPAPGRPWYYFVAQISGRRDGYSVVNNYDCYTHLRPQ